MEISEYQQKENFEYYNKYNEIFLKAINKKASGIPLKKFGFDTMAISLGVSKNDLKTLWNKNDLGFKRITRTEYELKPRPDLMIKYKTSKMLYEVKCRDYLSFRLTPTTALIIPDGLITDLGSIPSALHWIADKDDIRFILAFLFHDVEYAQKILGRLLADGLILEVSAYMGAGWTVRNVIYTGVRAGGWLPYSKDPTEKDLENVKLIKRATEKFYQKNNITGDMIKFSVKNSV